MSRGRRLALAVDCKRLDLRTSVVKNLLLAGADVKRANDEGETVRLCYCFLFIIIKSLSDLG